MRISDSRRFLFVHVQKTGGMTVEAVIDELLPDIRWLKPGERHMPLAKILDRDPSLEEYWIAGFVRNPWARMLSWWSMFQHAKQRAEAGEERPKKRFETRGFWRDVAQYPDFDTFLERGPDEHKRLRRPQIDYLTTPTRSADLIGRTESLDQDLQTILARLELPAPAEVPRVNPSPTGGSAYREHYSAAGRDRVAEVFRKDIDAFGYEY